MSLDSPIKKKRPVGEARKKKRKKNLKEKLKKRKIEAILSVESMMCSTAYFEGDVSEIVNSITLTGLRDTDQVILAKSSEEQVGELVEECDILMNACGMFPLMTFVTVFLLIIICSSNITLDANSSDEPLEAANSTVVIPMGDYLKMKEALNFQQKYENYLAKASRMYCISVLHVVQHFF